MPPERKGVKKYLVKLPEDKVDALRPILRDMPGRTERAKTGMRFSHWIEAQIDKWLKKNGGRQ
jgi:hypothetical protein